MTEYSTENLHHTNLEYDFKDILSRKGACSLPNLLKIDRKIARSSPRET